MEQLKTSYTELIASKVEEAMKTTSVNVEDTYAKVVARSTPKRNATSNSKKDDESDNHNIKKCFRIQANTEDVEISRGQKPIPTTETVDDVLKTIGVQPQIVKKKRLETPIKERAKPRTILVTVSAEHEAGKVLAKSFENPDKIVDKKCLSHIRID